MEDKKNWQGYLPSRLTCLVLVVLITLIYGLLLGKVQTKHNQEIEVMRKQLFHTQFMLEKAKEQITELTGDENGK